MENTIINPVVAPAGTPEQTPDTFRMANEEILATGTFKGFEFTPEKLKELADNYNRLESTVRPAVKLGHGEQEILSRSGFPAAGYLTNIRVSQDGQTLLSDIVDVPAAVKELIDRKAYKRKSAEVVIDYKDPNIAAGESMGSVIVGLALLGEEMPEVKTLSDIKRLYYSDDINKSILINLSSNNKGEVKMANLDPQGNPIPDATATPVETIAAEKPAEDVIEQKLAEDVGTIVGQLEKIIEKLYEMCGPDAMDEVMMSKAEKAITQLAAGLKKSKKQAAAPAEKSAEAAPAEMSASVAPVADPAVTAKLSDMENKMKAMAIELEKSKAEKKAAEIEKLNFSDEVYVKELIDTGKIAPVQAETIKKLFFSVNATASNVIHLSDKETVSIKDSFKAIIAEMPVRVDLSEKTTNSTKTDQKAPDEIKIADMKEKFPQYFKK